MVIAGDYETRPPKEKKTKGRAVAQAKPDMKPDATSGAKSDTKPKSAPAKQCHLSIKVLGLCI